MIKILYFLSSLMRTSNGQDLLEYVNWILLDIFKFYLLLLDSIIFLVLVWISGETLICNCLFKDPNLSIKLDLIDG